MRGGDIMLYEYLKKVYGDNEPIIISDIKIAGLSTNTLRQQLKKLTDSGLLKRYDTGIYFIPRKSVFKSGNQLSIDHVIYSKYLRDSDHLCGYISGIGFANQLGLTTQIPTVYEIVTNKASTDYRKTKLAQSKIIIRKPKITITQDNYKVLQFLDLLRDIDQIAEVSDEMIKKRLMEYLNATSLTFKDLEKYLPFYPDKVYKNMYETGLLNGITTP